VAIEFSGALGRDLFSPARLLLLHPRYSVGVAENTGATLVLHINQERIDQQNYEE
jgi:hypothetical protein